MLSHQNPSMLFFLFLPNLLYFLASFQWHPNILLVNILPQALLNKVRKSILEENIFTEYKMLHILHRGKHYWPIELFLQYLASPLFLCLFLYDTTQTGSSNVSNIMYVLSVNSCIQYEPYHFLNPDTHWKMHSSVHNLSPLSLTLGNFSANPIFQRWER